MKTCKDCFHYVVCQYHITEETDMTVNECFHFKDKAKIVEIPSIHYSEIHDAWVLYTVQRDCLQTCIMTKEQAEQAIKELSK